MEKAKVRKGMQDMGTFGAPVSRRPPVYPIKERLKKVWSAKAT